MVPFNLPPPTLGGWGGGSTSCVLQEGLQRREKERKTWKWQMSVYPRGH